MDAKEHEYVEMQAENSPSLTGSGFRSIVTPMEVRSIEAIAGALHAAGVRYLIVGGLAVNAHGYERLTRDLDLVIGLEPGNITRGLRALLDIGYRMVIPITPEEFADAGRREKWRKEKNMIVLKLWSDTHRRTPIDVFVYEPFDFEREHAAATQIEVAAGLAVTVIGYEGLITMKLAAGREKDLQDVAALRKLEAHR